MSAQIRRREFITLLGGAAVAWPVAARAQQPMPLIAYVSSASADASYMTAFRQGLADLGYTDGRNVTVEFHWAEGRFERLPALLADLIQRRVAVIAVGGVTSGLAAKAATTTIPIVFLAADDPVKFGLVASLSRPSGNATGLNLLTSELTTKRLELIRGLVPTASVIAVLVNPRSPESEPQSRDIERAAGAVGQQIRILNASTDQDIDAAFATLVKQRDAALLVTNDALFSSTSRDQIVTLASHCWRTAKPTSDHVFARSLAIQQGTSHVRDCCTPICRIASVMPWPCETRTSTWRSFATISSGL